MIAFRTLLSATAAVLALSFPGMAEDHPEGIHIHDPYARSMGGVGASGAVFFMIHNHTEADERLVGAKADVAQKVELHTHKEGADGVMQMVEIEGGIPLAAGAMHELARGADHVMLMGLTRELKDGEVFPLTLVFESGTEVSVDVTVDNARKPGAAGEGMMNHGEGGHGHMNHGTQSGG